jgi:hypothetical protein
VTEATAQLRRRPADRWRLRGGDRALPSYDLEAFFRRPAREVADADIWRWRACVEADVKLRAED